MRELVLQEIAVAFIIGTAQLFCQNEDNRHEDMRQETFNTFTIRHSLFDSLDSLTWLQVRG